MQGAEECADRIDENRVDAELLCCFSKNQQLPNSEEIPNRFGLEWTHVSKTNNKKNYSSRSVERPILPSENTITRKVLLT